MKHYEPLATKRRRTDVQLTVTYAVQPNVNREQRGIHIEPQHSAVKNGRLRTTGSEPGEPPDPPVIPNSATGNHRNRWLPVRKPYQRAF